MTEPPTCLANKNLNTWAEEADGLKDKVRHPRESRLKVTPPQLTLDGSSSFFHLKFLSEKLD